MRDRLGASRGMWYRRRTAHSSSWYWFTGRFCPKGESEWRQVTQVLLHVSRHLSPPGSRMVGLVTTPWAETGRRAGWRLSAGEAFAFADRLPKTSADWEPPALTKRVPKPLHSRGASTALTGRPLVNQREQHWRKPFIMPEKETLLSGRAHDIVVNLSKSRTLRRQLPHLTRPGPQ